MRIYYSIINMCKLKYTYICKNAMLRSIVCLKNTTIKT